MSFSRPRHLAVARDVLTPDFGDEINAGCTLWAPFNEGAGTGTAAQAQCIISNVPSLTSYGGGSTTALEKEAPTPGGGHYYGGSTGYGASWVRATGNRTPDTTKFAFSVWFRGDNVVTVTDSALGLGTTGGTGWSDGFGLTVDGNTAAGTRNFKFWPRSYTGVAASGSSTEFGSTSKWYHIVGVRNGDTAYIYVDGSQRGSYSVGATATTFSATYIGLASGAGGGYPLGYSRWHDFRVWGRALSDSEVRRLYVERGNCGLLMPRRRIWTPAAAAASNHNLMPMLGVGD